jgi:hypothetical protein
LRVKPGEQVVADDNDEELIPADAQSDSTIAAPRALSGAAVDQVADLQRQLAEANAVIQMLQQRIQQLTAGQESSRAPAPIDDYRAAAPVPNPTPMPMAVPIAPAAPMAQGPFCALFGFGC